jgi:hypothetical protein
MRRDRGAHDSPSPDDIQRMIGRAARQGIVLERRWAETLASLGRLTSARRVDHACRLIKVAREENLDLTFPVASQRIDACGGDVEEAIRRMLAGGAETRDGVPEMVEYAADRGLTLSPRTIQRLITSRGRGEAQAYIDKLTLIMDAAASFGVDCTQISATRRLSLAEGDARRVVAAFAAEHRRRSDRQTIACRVKTPPRELRERANAFAGCGCPRCRDRLAIHMQRYIGKLIAAPFFRDLDRDEARAEANLELLISIETWPGGNFTGWFAERFLNRVRNIYRSRYAAERHQTVSLDADWVLAESDRGRTVPLGERIPDLTVDVIVTVLLRERFAEAALELRRLRAERGEQYKRGESGPDQWAA